MSLKLISTALASVLLPAIAFACVGMAPRTPVTDEVMELRKLEKEKQSYTTPKGMRIELTKIDRDTRKWTNWEGKAQDFCSETYIYEVKDILNKNVLVATHSAWNQCKWMPETTEEKTGKVGTCGCFRARGGCGGGTTNVSAEAKKLPAR